MSSSPFNREPDVSVLMSCYNASRWLHEAIDSVLAQTHSNFELILINDGSTDETWNIIQNYQDRDQRIVALSKQNTGLADSLNVGLSKAKGAWIARLDADDFCEPMRLEQQLDFVRNHPEVVLLGAGFVEIDEAGRSIKTQLYPSRHRKLLRHMERSQRFFPHSSAFFSRQLARDVGGYNPLFRKTQDRDLWFRFAERGEIACLADCLVRVRKHMAQISKSTEGVPQLVYGTAASVCHFLRIQGVPDPASRGETAWQELIKWLDRRILEEGVFEARKTWIDARSAYFATESRLTGAIRFGTGLLRSGYTCPLVWEKCFGTSLPERLAREWMKQSCAAS